MKSTDNYNNDYLGRSHKNGNTCPSIEIIYFKILRDATKAADFCPAPAEYTMSYIDNPFQMLQSVWRIWCTIMPALLWLALARVITEKYSRTVNGNSIWRFIIEFLTIVVPTVASINGINDSVEYIVLIMMILFCFVVWNSNLLEKISERTYKMGARPWVLTLSRASISYLTAYCILAIDFGTFPKSFRKSWRYGVGLMDTGIGLFVYSMGSVSKRPIRKSDLGRMMKTVIPLLLLGVARTVVLMLINYHQDEHEYGTHMNAFFTLGLSKFFGTLLSYVAKNDSNLLIVGIAVLAIHEICLQLGVAEFVMDPGIARSNLITSNREGLCSLPGFVGVFIISMYLGKIWQTKETPLTFEELMQKMKHIWIVATVMWICVILSIFTVSIARVTCNFGYAVWTLGIASSMNLLFMLVFEIILNTNYPIEERAIAIVDGGEGATLLPSSSFASKTCSKYAIPSIIEAVNLNGLVFFLVSNILTGGVNIFLKPEFRTNFEGYLILNAYMFIAFGVVYVLYRRNIRIA